MAKSISDPITSAEVARICGVTATAVFNWTKASGYGPRSEMVEYPGLNPRRMYSRAEVEAFAKTRKPVGAPNSRAVEALAVRVEVLERAVEALGAKS